MPPKRKKAKFAMTEEEENRVVDILEKAYTDHTLARQWAKEDSGKTKGAGSRSRGSRRHVGAGMIDMEIADLLDLPDVKTSGSKSQVLQLLRKAGFHNLYDVMSIPLADWDEFVEKTVRPHFRPTLRIIHRRAVQALEHDKKI